MIPNDPSNVVAWTQLLGQVGFPVVVAGYLLVKILPALNRLTSAIEKLVILAQRRGGLSPFKDDRPKPARRR